MKTIKYIAIVAALTLATGMTSCKSDEENNAKPSNETLVVEGGNKQIVMKAGDEMMSLNINADCAWTVDSIIAGEFGDDDFFIQPMRGYGNGTLVIITEQNKEVFGRKASFILKTDGGLKQKVTIQQTSGDPIMSISERSLEYDPIPTSAQTLTEAGLRVPSDSIMRFIVRPVSTMSSTMMMWRPVRSSLMPSTSVTFPVDVVP